MARTQREAYFPIKRTEDLVVKHLHDEVLVYDLRRHKALCLNGSAAVIWDMCDGNTDVVGIATSLSGRMNRSVEEEIVWMGLRSLSRARLLTAASPRGGPDVQESRRRMLKKLGIAAAVISLPIVASIIAPTAVSAASCATLGQQCGGSHPACCGGLGLGCVLGLCVEI